MIMIINAKLQCAFLLWCMYESLKKRLLYKCMQDKCVLSALYICSHFFFLCSLWMVSSQTYQIFKIETKKLSWVQFSCLHSIQLVNIWHLFKNRALILIAHLAVMVVSNLLKTTYCYFSKFTVCNLKFPYCPIFS